MRFDQTVLSRVPPAARLDLAGTGLRMEVPLAGLRELEVLGRGGYLDLAAFDSGLVERAIEHPPRRADEGATGQILLIARLLADQHDRGADGAFAEQNGRAHV